MKITKREARKMCISAGLDRKDYYRLRLREEMEDDAVRLLISVHLKRARKKVA